MALGFGTTEAPSPATIFVSSTFYDLRPIRQELQSHLESLGYIAVLFEHAGAVPNLAAPLSALRHASQADICLLIVGGRYGSLSDDNTTSWVHREFRTAKDLGKPIFVFVDADALSRYELYSSRPDPNFWKQDEQALFKFIREVSMLGSRFPFSTLPELKSQLRFQLASYFGYLVRRYSDIEAFGPSTSATWRRVAGSEVKRGEFGKAVFCYRQALDLDPNDKYALIGIAYNLWRLGRNQEAETYARRGVLEYPRVPSFRIALCQALRDQGRLDDALTEAKEFTRLFPRDDRSWGVLSLIHERRGENEEAAEAARKAYEVAGKSTQRLYRLLALGTDPELLEAPDQDVFLKTDGETS